MALKQPECQATLAGLASDAAPLMRSRVCPKIRRPIRSQSDASRRLSWKFFPQAVPGIKISGASDEPPKFSGNIFLVPMAAWWQAGGGGGAGYFMSGFGGGIVLESNFSSVDSV
jgi:hypothetical protein